MDAGGYLEGIQMTCSRSRHVSVFRAPLQLRNKIFVEGFSTICTARRIVVAAHTQDSFSLSRFSCGESPRRYRACPRLFYGKQPALSTTVLVEDGEKDLPESLGLVPGSLSFTLSFFFDGGPSIKARVCEDMSISVARRFHPRMDSSLLIDIVIRLLNLYGSSTQWGSLSGST